MRSGELARRAGVSADTIRHYERLRLLKVAPRTASGYRDYPLEALERVRLIRRALGLGFSLEELAKILEVRDRGGAPCQAVFASATSKLKDVEQQIEGLKTMRRLLRSILREWRGRLDRTPKYQAARLLENLSREMEERANAIHRDIRRNLGFRRSNVQPKSGHGKSLG